MFHQVLFANLIYIDILHTLRKVSKPYVKCFLFLRLEPCDNTEKNGFPPRLKLHKHSWNIAQKEKVNEQTPQATTATLQKPKKRSYENDR